MKQNTYKMIELALNGDDEVSPEEKRSLLQYLASYNGPARPGRILKGEEVANRLGISSRTVRNYREQGLLVPFRPEGRVNATGYLESDVDAFLAAHGAGHRGKFFCDFRTPVVLDEAAPCARGEEDFSGKFEGGFAYALATRWPLGFRLDKIECFAGFAA